MRKREKVCKAPPHPLPRPHVSTCCQEMTQFYDPIIYYTGKQSKRQVSTTEVGESSRAPQIPKTSMAQQVGATNVTPNLDTQGNPPPSRSIRRPACSMHFRKSMRPLEEIHLNFITYNPPTSHSMYRPQRRQRKSPSRLLHRLRPRQPLFYRGLQGPGQARRRERPLHDLSPTLPPTPSLP